MELWSCKCDVALHRPCAGPRTPPVLRGLSRACARSVEPSVGKEIKVPLLNPPSSQPEADQGDKGQWPALCSSCGHLLSAVLGGPCGCAETSPRYPHGKWDCVLCVWQTPWFDGRGEALLLLWSPWRLLSFYCFCELMLGKQWFSICCSMAGTLLEHRQTETPVAFQHPLPAPLLMAELRAWIAKLPGLQENMISCTMEEAREKV